MLLAVTTVLGCTVGTAMLGTAIGTAQAVAAGAVLAVLSISAIPYTFEGSAAGLDSSRYGEQTPA